VDRSTAALDLAELASLRARVAAHDVRCEVYPERIAHDGRLEQVGFTIELFGRHNHPSQPPEPGCRECELVHRELARIARAVVPRERRPSVVEVDPFEPTLVFDGNRPPRVRLTLRLVHRASVGGGVDECERRCLQEILAALQALGVPTGRH
jgi:hypothetical protein